VEIKFWYDASCAKLIVVHIPSQERREIVQIRKVQQFLEAYRTTLEELKRVQTGDDRLSLFKRMRVRKV
jgi:hypothetical protein